MNVNINYNDKNIHIIEHPLIKHKISILRDVNTNTKMFREIVNELSILIAYESFKNIDLIEEVDVQTPFQTIKQNRIKEDTLAIVPILRAGLGMVDGILTLFPAMKVGHIGLYRDEKTLKPCTYYCKLPKNIKNMTAMIVDPMLATGGSASDAISKIKQTGCKKIKLLSIIAAPIGIKTIHDNHPDVEMYVAQVDECLNDKGYILPGLGDAGDRIYGTK